MLCVAHRYRRDCWHLRKRFIRVGQRRRTATVPLLLLPPPHHPRAESGETCAKTSHGDWSGGSAEQATWEVSRYKKRSEHVRSGSGGRECRIYGDRARHLVKTTPTLCPRPVNTNDYSRNAGTIVVESRSPRKPCRVSDIDTPFRAFLRNARVPWFPNGELEQK